MTMLCRRSSSPGIEQIDSGALIFKEEMRLARVCVIVIHVLVLVMKLEVERCLD
jgi:hypothetical protein